LNHLSAQIRGAKGGKGGGGRQRRTKSRRKLSEKTATAWEKKADQWLRARTIRKKGKGVEKRGGRSSMRVGNGTSGRKELVEAVATRRPPYRNFREAGTFVTARVKKG